MSSRKQKVTKKLSSNKVITDYKNTSDMWFLKICLRIKI